jgi:hypothetical protein
MRLLSMRIAVYCADELGTGGIFSFGYQYCE